MAEETDRSTNIFGIIALVMGIIGAAMAFSQYQALIAILVPLLAIFLGLIGLFKHPRRYAALGILIGLLTMLRLLRGLAMLALV